jgi:hypothetical protein
MKTTKIVILCVICISLGFLVGALLTTIAARQQRDKLVSVMWFAFVAQQDLTTQDIYLKQTSSDAIGAQLAFLAMLEGNRPLIEINPHLGATFFQNQMWILNGRLFKLYRQGGNNAKAELHMTRAIDALQVIQNRPATEDTLLDALNVLDSIKNNE